MASRKTSEIQRLQDEISNEIKGDAPEIATMVFGEARDQPDVVSVRNERLDDVYRQAYVKNDRQWLQQEARRDPEQFLKVTDRIGVSVPQTPPGLQPLQPGAFARTALQAPQTPVQPTVPTIPPVAPPMLPVPPVAPVAPVAAAPMILGPNGQPLPPSGLM